MHSFKKLGHFPRLASLPPVVIDPISQATWPGFRQPHDRRPRLTDSQLLHHCPHRPWQVDAGGPFAAGHGHGGQPGHAGAVPGQHGPGA